MKQYKQTGGLSLQTVWIHLCCSLSLESPTRPLGGKVKEGVREFRIYKKKTTNSLHDSICKEQ